MFIDLVGYTSRSSQLGRDELNALHDRFDGLVKPVFSAHDGNIVKKIGDAFLVTFDSPTNALHCGIKLQEKFGAHNQISNDPLSIRVALDNGDVLIRDNDVYGDAVNIASRVESSTAPGHVYFTESVAHAMNKNEFNFVDVGIGHFKGVPNPIRMFRIKPEHEKKAEVRGRIIEIVLGVGFVIFLVVFIIWLMGSGLL
jgi:class 3 adenylate cyclase